MINESKLDKMIGGPPRVIPTSYPPPAYPVGVIDGQPFQYTQENQWHPYIEVWPMFFNGGECNN